jgi:carbon monoxide dehydrogenase subunit G
LDGNEKKRLHRFAESRRQVFMGWVTLSAFVNAPRARVFHLFADVENAPGRVKGIKRVELLTSGPVGLGTRFKETRLMFNREATEVMEFTAFDPDRSYTLGCDTCGARYVSTFRFEPEGDGTRVTYEFEYRARSILAWLMKPLGWLMRGMIRKCVQQDIDDLKAFAEKEPAASS